MNWGLLFVSFVLFGAGAHSYYSALTPPLGWNSYDSFTWVINETEYLANCLYLKMDLPAYEYCVIDYLWYQDLDAKTLYIDDNGRVIPDPNRWPSTNAKIGFTNIADRVHSLGLKFGIHIMRGISQAAYDANSPILGTNYHAQDIALTDQRCPWYTNMMSVNISHPGGQAYVNSLYQQYASWGVDYIKYDCVFGSDFVPDQILATSEAMKLSGRPMVYSLSPGDTGGGESGSEITKAEQIMHNVSIYRVTGDDWDNWNDLYPHFEVAKNFAAAGIDPGPGKDYYSWPDLDMLPLGWISGPGQSNGPYRWCSLTHDEQRLQVSLWAIARSPLMMGGDLRQLDRWTASLLNNTEVLRLNQMSSNNHQLSEFSVKISILSEDKGPKDGPVNVQVADCDSSPEQQWELNSDSSISSVKTAECLDIWDCGTSDGTCVDLYECHVDQTGCDQNGESSNQQWKLNEDATITSLMDHKCLDVYNGVGPNVEAWSCHGGDNQKWNYNENKQLVNQFAQQCLTSARSDLGRIWTAKGLFSEVYLGYFSVGELDIEIAVSFEDLGFAHGTSCMVRDLWSGEVLGRYDGALFWPLRSHEAALFSLFDCVEVHSS